MTARAVPLSRLLVSGRAPDAVVAFARGRQETFSDWAGRVEACARALRAGPGRASGSRFLLLAADSYDFAVGLFAIARAGGVAVLPPNRQPGTIGQLAAQVAGVVGDLSADDLPSDGGAGARPDGRPLLDPREIAPLPLEAIPRDAVLDPAAVVAELFTSGSTGEAKPVEKTLSHLEREVIRLEATFLPPSDARVFATVSHQHLYGLLFRVLWPLCAGRAFSAETPLHPEELLPRLAEAPASLLVATPVHLRRMVHRPGLRGLAGRLGTVFSSGGPLDAGTAAGIAAALGAAPVEIFGSTETGGVATRQRRGADPARLDPAAADPAHVAPAAVDPSDGDAAWTPLGDVRIAATGDGRLHVRSPFVSDGGAGSGFVMGDRVEIRPDGRFQLLGRADRVVKVGEKRLSLPEMESSLLSHAWVEEVALVPLEQGNETRVGAVVVLDEAARRAAERDRRALLAALTEHLAPSWDRVLLPRAWRLVDALPRDAQGKLPSAALRALFEERGRPLLPALEPLEDGVFRGRVPEDLAALEGHFPGHPVVPGVVQLLLAHSAVARWLGARATVRGVEALKFHRPLLPGDVFRLQLERKGGGVLGLEIRGDEAGALLTTARLRLTEGASA